jgi:subtilisin family serine protease
MEQSQHHYYVPTPFNKQYLDMRCGQKNEVIVAVMDTGIDPGALGLMYCPDGSKKIIDVIDCTGSDDIIVHKATTDQIKTRNLESLLNNHDMQLSFTGSFYIGARSLRSFVSQRKYDDFADAQKKIIDGIILDVVIYVEPDNTLATKCFVNYGDALIVLSEYTVPTEGTRHYGSIGIGDNLYMNFAFHLYPGLTDPGSNLSSLSPDLASNLSPDLSCDPDYKICSLVFDTGGHGTHVAGIIGGYFKDNIEMNGVNPYCKILSLKIGDSRLNGMETSIALCRALRELVKYDCHIVNLSYGEPLCDTKGVFFDMLNEFTYKHNITFVSSGGNSGPNISTIGAPCTATDRVISVGAYTDKQYLNTLYSMSGNCYNKGVYDWSSRGPGMDGSMGIDVIAPGCALTCHPTWDKSYIKMCNGTSMAAPNTTGFLSLIMGQFNPLNYPHTYWVKKYLEHTCEKMNHFEVFSQGHGLIGQKYIELDFFDNVFTLSNKFNPLQLPPDAHMVINVSAAASKQYYFEFNINNDDTKTGFVNILNANLLKTSDRYPTMTYFTASIRICPMVLNRYTNFVHCNLDIRYEIYDKNNQRVDNVIIGPNNVMIHPGCETVRFGLSNKDCYSGYIKFYQNNNPNYVISIPVNQFIYNEVDKDNTIECAELTLTPGSVNRIYCVFKCNHIIFTMNHLDIKENVIIDIIQHFKGVGYDKRSSSVTFTKQSVNKNFNHKLIPNVLTEIAIYVPWDAPCNELISYKITGEQNNIVLNKKCFETNELIQVNVSQSSTAVMFKSTFNINSIGSKYYPISANILPTDPRYVDKLNQRLKRLRLTYKINNHPKCSYHIDTNNKVYDSNIYMSGSISGYMDNKQVFFANYVPKMVEGQVDTCYIDFMDSDDAKLAQCRDTVLIATRNLEPIKVTISLIPGANFVQIPLKKIASEQKLYNGDHVQCSILNETFIVIHRDLIDIEGSDKNIVKSGKRKFSHNLI